jgi:hypothetical protein
MKCPTCDQPWPGGLIWHVDQGEGQFSVTVNDGRGHTGWALRKTEEEARDKALARMLYDRDYLSKGLA